MAKKDKLVDLQPEVQSNKGRVRLVYFGRKNPKKVGAIKFIPGEATEVERGVAMGLLKNAPDIFVEEGGTPTKAPDRQNFMEKESDQSIEDRAKAKKAIAKKRKARENLADDIEGITDIS